MKLGIIGGSGLYSLATSGETRQHDVATAFGAPSGPITATRIGDVDALFLPRHGAGHRYSPTEINYRANVAAMKQLGATHLVSVSAVGSMREDIAPGDLVVVDQYIDLTKRRASSFFEGGVAAHVAFADPVCPLLSRATADAAREASGSRVHEGGTYLCMEGPQFSTRAESVLYRSWGVAVIGMTAMPEAKLAREAELPYATLALATDYDCWHKAHGPVDVQAVVEVMAKNVEAARRTLLSLVARLPDPAASPAHRALDGAIMTSRADIPAETARRLSFLRPFST